MSDADSQIAFSQLGLAPPVLQAIDDVGYETPTPIQSQTIPHLLEGNDLLGMAQTGTGKTAAFALPLLSRLDFKRREPQLLVLAPTRELALQVAEACQSYAKHIKDFHVLPIYGGQSYDTQLRSLKRGSQVIVGTPGRVMDHIKRGTLNLSKLSAMVLDEADEMLRMGFIDDVEWILKHTPKERQIALFSATMPDVIKRVAENYLNNPVEIRVAAQSSTAKTITQKYWRVSGMHKLDALTRILEVQTFEAMIVFVRTKSATEELAEKLAARGYAAEALNGDMSQQQRERTVDRLKSGRTDILVATDVVARGLDVERISTVLNYDIPHDAESYVHRIGRTGRAGRKGEAILFVAPREQRLLKTIERVTKQTIEHMELPSVGDVNEQRMKRFTNKITEVLSNEDLSPYIELISQYHQENENDPLNIAAALAHIAQGDQPLWMKEPERRPDRRDRNDRGNRRERGPRRDYDGPQEQFEIAVGRSHGVMPKNIVGAIANEGNIDAAAIGHIKIRDEFSMVSLPEGLPADTIKRLQRAVVCGQRLNLKRSDRDAGEDNRPRRGRNHGKPRGDNRSRGRSNGNR